MTASVSRAETRSVELLRRRTTYAESPGSVEPIERHLSWVFLTDRFAYKLKKRAQFDALDFSSSQQRHQACQDELRVNRRWAPDVYLAVLPITCTARGRLQLNGGGTPVDWVVKMRRLPRQRTLRHLLLSGRLGRPDLRVVAERLARDYSRQPPLMVQPDTYRRQLTQRIRANLDDLLASLPALASTITEVHLSQLRHLASQAGVFDHRVCDGRVIDGHGDLRPEHVFVLPSPVVIDGLASSCQLRQVDIADDLSLLAMECELLGCGDVGRALLQRYVKLTGDRPAASLMAFYKSYRACLRARVLVLLAARGKPPARAHSLESAEAYLAQATEYLGCLGK
jgi:aminoglycoside phosphotransferase family enzyme